MEHALSSGNGRVLDSIKNRTVNAMEVIHSCTTRADVQQALRIDFRATCCCLLRATVIGFGEKQLLVNRMYHQQKGDLLHRFLYPLVVERACL
jgi:hypothetical protein